MDDNIFKHDFWSLHKRNVSLLKNESVLYYDKFLKTKVKAKNDIWSNSFNDHKIFTNKYMTIHEPKSFRRKDLDCQV